MTPELNASGHPLSGAAANGAAMLNKDERGRKTRVSASRKMTFEYWVRRNRCSLVNEAARSLRPVVN